MISKFKYFLKKPGKLIPPLVLCEPSSYLHGKSESAPGHLARAKRVERLLARYSGLGTSLKHAMNSDQKTVRVNTGTQL